MYSFVLCYVEEKTCCGCAVARFLRSCASLLFGVLLLTLAVLISNLLCAGGMVLMLICLN